MFKIIIQYSTDKEADKALDIRLKLRKILNIEDEVNLLYVERKIIK